MIGDVGRDCLSASLSEFKLSLLGFAGTCPKSVSEFHHDASPTAVTPFGNVSARPFHTNSERSTRGSGGAGSFGRSSKTTSREIITFF